MLFLLWKRRWIRENLPAEVLAQAGNERRRRISPIYLAPLFIIRSLFYDARLMIGEAREGIQ